jgi:hypothetical protein
VTSTYLVVTIMLLVLAVAYGLVIKLAVWLVRSSWRALHPRWVCPSCRGWGGWPTGDEHVKPTQPCNRCGGSGTVAERPLTGWVQRVR